MSQKNKIILIITVAAVLLLGFIFYEIFKSSSKTREEDAIKKITTEFINHYGNWDAKKTDPNEHQKSYLKFLESSFKSSIINSDQALSLEGYGPMKAMGYKTVVLEQSSTLKYLSEDKITAEVSIVAKIEIEEDGEKNQATKNFLVYLKKEQGRWLVSGISEERLLN